jgi:hypothetical protein
MLLFDTLELQNEYFWNAPFSKFIDFLETLEMSTMFCYQKNVYLCKFLCFYTDTDVLTRLRFTVYLMQRRNVHFLARCSLSIKQ